MVTVIDHTGLSCGPLGPRANVFEHEELHAFAALAATVDGVPWTTEQTEQAKLDGRVCGCGTCACCEIRRAIFSRTLD